MSVQLVWSFCCLPFARNTQDGTLLEGHGSLLFPMRESIQVPLQFILVCFCLYWSMADSVICKYADFLCYTLREVVNIKEKEGRSLGDSWVDRCESLLAAFDHRCLLSVPEEALDPEIGVAVDPIASQLVLFKTAFEDYLYNLYLFIELCLTNVVF